LEEVVSTAREGNLSLRVAELGAEAAFERVSPAGALPDPVLSLGLMNRPLDDFGTDERMTMNVFELSQRLPWPGKLGFREQRMAYLAEAARFSASETEAVLTARVASAYFELAFIDRAIEIMVRTGSLLHEFLEVASALYEVGRGLQNDVLQAQIALAQVSEEIASAEQRRRAMAARLNALLGQEATAEIGPTHLPWEFPSLPSPDSLMSLAAGRRPGLHAARQRSLAAGAGVRAAARDGYPDFQFRVSYGQRPQFDDMATVMLGVTVPLWAGSKQHSIRREMEVEQAVEQARERDLLNETFARLVELTAESERARSLIELYETAILPQARAAVESAVSAYGVGQVDFMTLVTNELTVNRYEIERVRLATDYHRAQAEVEALIGGRLEVER
jgi:outer membrane protein TolC